MVFSVDTQRYEGENGVIGRWGCVGVGRRRVGNFSSERSDVVLVRKVEPEQ